MKKNICKLNYFIQSKSQQANLKYFAFLSQYKCHLNNFNLTNRKYEKLGRSQHI